MREDTDVFPLLEELLDCVCREIVASDLPPVCRCELMPGTQVVLDFQGSCGEACGQAWVRLVAIGAGAAFPDIGTPELARCGTTLAAAIEVGISRCEPSGETLGQRYTPPTAKDQHDAVRLYMADMAAMRRAVVCCFAEKYEDVVDVAMGVYSPLDSAGGAGGGAWQVFLRRT